MESIKFLDELILPYEGNIVNDNLQAGSAAT